MQVAPDSGDTGHCTPMEKNFAMTRSYTGDGKLFPIAAAAAMSAGAALTKVVAAIYNYAELRVFRLL